MNRYKPGSKHADAYGWEVFAEGQSMWALRPTIRYLLNHGYDWDATILIEAIDEAAKPEPVLAQRELF